MAKKVLITGASSGIGLEFAHIFAQKRYELILVARNKQKLTELKQKFEKKYRSKVTVIVADLSNQNSITQVIKHVHDVDVLVNNAGLGHLGEFNSYDWQRDHQMISVNMYALTALTKAIVPGMIARKKGRILNVASTAAFQPGPHMAVYFATKSYVLSFSEALAYELQGSGVTVTALCPGPTASHFQETAGQQGVFDEKKLPTSQEVAEFGYSAMLAGKTVAIHGGTNRFLAFIGKFIPRKMLLKEVAKMMGKS